MAEAHKQLGGAPSAQRQPDGKWKVRVLERFETDVSTLQRTRHLDFALAMLLPGEDHIEVLVVTQRTVRVVRTQRFASESFVIVGAEF